MAPLKFIHFFKCAKCGVEFFIYSERENIEKYCGECKHINWSDEKIGRDI